MRHIGGRSSSAQTFTHISMAMRCRVWNGSLSVVPLVRAADVLARWRYGAAVVCLSGAWFVLPRARRGWPMPHVSHVAITVRWGVGWRRRLAGGRRGHESPLCPGVSHCADKSELTTMAGGQRAVNHGGPRLPRADITTACGRNIASRFSCLPCGSERPACGCCLRLYEGKV